MGFDAITGPNWIVPTPPPGDSSNRVADTAFVTLAIASATAALATSIVNSVTASTGLGQNATTGFVTLFTNLSHTSASLGADVNLTSTTTYFDGPSVAQGTTGTWYVSGTVTVDDTAGAANIRAKLWDGSTVIDSTTIFIVAANAPDTGSLSGVITSPAGNLRISCLDANSAAGKIYFNKSGNSKDSTITAIRIA